MNIYHPYDTLTDTEECLHLKQNESRERLQFITLRVVPILLMLFVWYVLQQVGTMIPMGWNYALIIITLVVALLLLARSYTTEIKIIKQKEIFLIVKTIFGTQEKKIDIIQATKLLIVRKSGKAGYALFMIHVKPKKSYILLNIPPIAIDEHQIKIIKERLEDLLAMPAEESK